MLAADFSTARVIGFFSLPAPSLAEANPAAYVAAMAGAPAGAGSCAYCGTGIRNHVVIALATGAQVFIGCDCAERVGSETVRRCVRDGITSEVAAARDAKRSAECAEVRASVAARQAELAARQTALADVLTALRAQGSAFHASLADQLATGPLSPRQADYVIRALIGRVSKRNTAAAEALELRCTG